MNTPPPQSGSNAKAVNASDSSIIATRTPLWVWVGLRMSAIGIGSVLLIAFGMWLRYAILDHNTLGHLPASTQQEVATLLDHPSENQDRLWEVLQQYYNVEDILPGMASHDWWLLAGLIAVAIPLIVAAGLVSSRPLSRQFLQVAGAAHRVTEGDFKTRARIVADAPAELRGLAEDFNQMAAGLQQYERELRDSHAMLAHELRTPLTAATGRVQGMLEEVFPSDRTQLSMVLRQLEQINRLVGDLHFISLASAGQMQMEREQFDLGALLEERLSWAAIALEEAGVVHSVDGAVGMPVFGDRDRIGQVLSILIDNVVRYAASGGRLDIQCSASGREVVITCGDRGEGVPAEDLDKMRDRFWRADRSRARHSGGSGLGLAIAASICRAHGGSLAFSLRDGGGLLATVRLAAGKRTAAQPR